MVLGSNRWSKRERKKIPHKQTRDQTKTIFQNKNKTKLKFQTNFWENATKNHSSTGKF